MLNVLWPSTKIIHGKPRKPQSQGHVENANNRVENILQSLLEKECHSHWAKLLDKVAYMKNTSLHTLLNSSPYKVLYGRDQAFIQTKFSPRLAHTRLNYPFCIKSMEASLDLRAPRKNSFKYTRLQARRIRLVETLVEIHLGGSAISIFLLHFTLQSIQWKISI